MAWKYYFVFREYSVIVEKYEKLKAEVAELLEKKTQAEEQKQIITG